MTTAAEMHARFKGIFVAASEQVLREIYAEDKRGEPSEILIEASREAAVSLYKLVCNMGPPARPAQIQASTKATDAQLMVHALAVLRPKIRALMATVRSS